MALLRRLVAACIIHRPASSILALDVYMRDRCALIIAQDVCAYRRPRSAETVTWP